MDEHEQEDDGSKFDLFSPHLDSELVLFNASESQIKNLDVDVRPLDSLYKARYILPEDDPDRLVAKRWRQEQNQDKEEEEEVVIRHPVPKPVKPQTNPAAKALEMPFTSIASRFVDGPMSLLRTSLNARVRVKVKRRAGVTSWCVGKLVGFDRHFNLLLTNAVERYSVKEEAVVSERRKVLKDKVMLFLSDFDSSNGDFEQRAELMLVKFGADEPGLWKHLQEEYGVRVKVGALEKTRDVKGLLQRWAGSEYQLIKHLEAKAKREPQPSPTVTAEWVRLPSEKYPGNFFYLNNRTGESVWEPPSGITFRRVLAMVPREKQFPQMIVRGDSVLLVSKVNEHALPAETSSSSAATTEKLTSSSNPDET